jgi:hypothetical protein
VKPAGWLLERTRRAEKRPDGAYRRALGDLGEQSGWLGGSGENWERGPYYLDGLVPLAYALTDEALKQKAQKWIEWMLSSADETGFFGPTDNLDWWPRMVALKVLTQYHEATGDPRVLTLMDRYFRCQLASLPNRPLAMWAARAGRSSSCPCSTFTSNGRGLPAGTGGTPPQADHPLGRAVYDTSLQKNLAFLPEPPAVHVAKRNLILTGQESASKPCAKQDRRQSRRRKSKSKNRTLRRFCGRFTKRIP